MSASLVLLLVLLLGPSHLANFQPLHEEAQYFLILPMVENKNKTIIIIMVKINYVKELTDCEKHLYIYMYKTGGMEENDGIRVSPTVQNI